MLTYAGSIVTCFTSISLLFWKFVSLHAGTERCIFVTTQVTSILASRTGKWYLNCQNWTGGVLDSYVRRTTNTSLSNHATYWHPMSWTRLTSYHNLNVALEEKKLHYLTGMDRLMQRTTICQRIKKNRPVEACFYKRGQHFVLIIIIIIFFLPQERKNDFHLKLRKVLLLVIIKMFRPGVAFLTWSPIHSLTHYHFRLFFNCNYRCKLEPYQWVSKVA